LSIQEGSPGAVVRWRVSPIDRINILLRAGQDTTNMWTGFSYRRKKAPRDNCMKIFAFDRDETVDVNGGPIPLGWVHWLARETHHEVWAVGNQLLVDEAGNVILNQGAAATMQYLAKS
jgi:hypothetical protein